MKTKNAILVIVGLVILGFLVVRYLFPSQRSQPQPEKKGAVGTAENVSKSVPKIVTNPAEKVPEVNPLDRANPFKYVNPLR